MVTSKDILGRIVDYASEHDGLCSEVSVGRVFTCKWDALDC